MHELEEKKPADRGMCAIISSTGGKEFSATFEIFGALIKGCALNGKADAFDSAQNKDEMQIQVIQKVRSELQ